MSGSLVIANGNCLGLDDASSGVAKLLVQSDNNLVLYGTDTSAKSRPLFSCFQHSDDSPLLVYPELLDSRYVDFHGAYGDPVEVAVAASIAANGATLTVNTALFTSSDVGKSIILPGAGASGTTLYASISGYVTATEVMLSAPASTALAKVPVTIVYGHDDSNAFQTAHNVVTAAGGGFVYLSARTYLISNQSVQASGRIIWQGKGWAENGSEGSWILQGSPTVSAFNVSGSAAVGGGFRDVGFRQMQTPITDSSGYLVRNWTPIEYAPMISVTGTGGEYSFERIMLLGVYSGVVATGAGRINFSTIRGEVFNLGIQLDQAFDCCVMHDVHFWPYWSNAAMNVVQWTQANADAVRLFRVDGAVFSGQTFAFGYRSAIRCSYGDGGGNAGYSGSANDFAVDFLYGDGCKYPLWIDDDASVMTSASGQIGKLYTGGETVGGTVTLAAEAASGATALVLASSAGIIVGAPILGAGLPTNVTVTVAAISGNTLTISAPTSAMITAGSSLSIGATFIPDGAGIQVDGSAQLQIGVARIFFHALSAVSLPNTAAPSNITIGNLIATATNLAGSSSGVIYAGNPVANATNPNGSPHFVELGTTPQILSPSYPPLVNAGSSLLGRFPDYGLEKIYPAPAGNYSFPNWVNTLILEPSVGGTVSSFTVAMPSFANRGRKATIVCAQNVASITFTSSAAVVAPPTSLAAGIGAQFVFDGDAWVHLL